MDSFGVGRRDASADETRAANRDWWDAEAVAYYAEHGSFLGDADLVWGPEGLTEADLHVLGDLAGRDVLEIGSGAAQGGRYVAGLGARVVSTDLSLGMLRQAQAIDSGSSAPLPLAQCDAAALPFADASFDMVFTAYGAVPFAADSGAIMREAARVLRPGGRFVFSTTHPVRWAFPDAPGAEGLVADRSYFDRTPYVEEGDDGVATYVEHHRTLGDRVREIVAAGLALVDLVEPEWPDHNRQVWGGWSPTRGRVIPGTAIFVTELPPSALQSARSA
ncbi:class I SAM-dependent methyltransferase [Flexivirga caeni]|uniref:Class I SAM-dependent methyltransferase n=1 Tax=Flexivirga caeni TaxID=2294115 RepID=A0A3M9MGD3_9MICO|nr:class I SAM-dependent methyltransferase [Flexivirga caeni]RNI24609.1 class I SAM-dependent methyltransferase [Flexivirga caeni]